MRAQHREGLLGVSLEQEEKERKTGPGTQDGVKGVRGRAVGRQGVGQSEGPWV